MNGWNIEIRQRDNAGLQIDKVGYRKLAPDPPVLRQRRVGTSTTYLETVISILQAK